MTSLADIMTLELVTLEPEMTLRQAIEILSDAGVSGAPVVVGERLVGVASASDILYFQSSSPGIPSYRSDQKDWGEWGPAQLWDEETGDPPSAFFREMWSGSEADLVERMGDPEGPEWDVLSEHVVAEVMTRSVLTLPPDAPLEEAARLMESRGIHRLIVSQDDRPVGLVSSMDFVRAVARGTLKPAS